MTPRKWSPDDLKTYKQWLGRMSAFYLILGTVVVLAAVWDARHRAGPSLEAGRSPDPSNEPVAFPAQVQVVGLSAGAAMSLLR